MSALPEGIICCDSCSFRIVAGDESSNGIEILCADCFKVDKEKDRSANEMMCAQIKHSIQGVVYG